MVCVTLLFLLMSLVMAQETTETNEDLVLGQSGNDTLTEEIFDVGNTPTSNENKTTEEQDEDKPDTKALIGQKKWFTFIQPTPVIFSTSTITNTVTSYNTVTSNSNSESCRYWCRNPQNQYYCCETSAQIAIATPIVKSGSCPAVRPVCPPTRHHFGPVTCSNDGSCGGTDKCCYDTCFQQHICKPIVASTSTTTVTITVSTVTYW